MGLIMSVLLPMSSGGSGIYLPPNDFLQAPELWLRAISAYRGTHACAPNFAYDLCANSIDGGKREGLDLSSWRYCCNAAEPVRASSMRRFEDVFSVCGVRPGLIQPDYGLAENTLYVSASAPLEPLTVVNEGRPELKDRELVACGRMSGHTVMIVDPLTKRVCEDGRVGEIWVQGESVAKGYWLKPDETEEVFGGRLPEFPGTFLRTGDLGFKHKGRLVISGRLKDLIILQGVNHYPQDLEVTAQSVSPELSTGAAFSVEGPEGERLVLVQETSRHPKTPLSVLAEEVIRAVTQEHGVQVSELLLVGPNSVPRTSSGKVQRRACRESYLNGGLKASWSRPSERPLPSMVSSDERLAWIRATALQLGGLEPLAGEDAPLDAWSLDSLKIAELSARYQRVFGQDLGALSRPDSTLRALLAERHEHGLMAAATDGACVDTAMLSTARRWRCHAALESIWAFQKAAPESNAYHMSWTVQLSGRPAPKSIEAALGALAQSQIAMRSSFELDENSTLWQIESPALVLLEQPWSSEVDLKQANQWAENWNRRPFDPAQAPLWRAAYLPLDDGGVLLAFAFHHLIFDQRSWEAFHESLEALVLDPRTALEPQSGAPPKRGEDVQVEDDTRRYWAGRLQGLAKETWLDHSQLSIPSPPRVLKAEVP
ncbi:MAG TPA: AMP-binding protein, partial [bacterium]|nr:AMP-binding protein [bacterium]